jgi:glyoxylase-like metal-dependent hydrolase (beta-lactamase superfamily II)
MVRRLADGVWLLPLRVSNAYLVDDGELTLIDAGLPWDADRLRRELGVLGHDVGDVDRILLTHYDLDHVGALRRLPFDAPVYAREPDASYLDGTRRPPLSSHRGVFHRLGGLLLTPPNLEVVRVDDGETVGSFTVHATPGHTEGHAAFVSTDRDVGALGDLVRERDGTLRASPWRLSYDTDAVEASIARLAEEAGAFSVAAVGHGEPPTENGSALLSKLAGRVEERASGQSI